jgi:hypothetical protein
MVEALQAGIQPRMRRLCQPAPIRLWLAHTSANLKSSYWREVRQ